MITTTLSTTTGRVVDLKKVEDFRARTFLTLPGTRLHSKEEAVEFVNRRGFIYFWPIQEIVLPSLWTAVAGDRPVADEHDDPGHATWGWKDALLGSRVWYYAKVLRKRATMISLDLAPYFYALTDNYGSPEEDYLTLYQQGRLTQEARSVFEALLFEGPLDTIALRRAARMTSHESDGRFNKALVDLQADFKILPVGVTDSGAWHYAFSYEVVHRHFPELIEQAHHIQENQAREKLAERYFQSVGAAQARDLVRVFTWTRPQADKTLNALTSKGLIVSGLQLENQPGEWFAVPGLLDDG